ncbi:MAG: hypothetical protein ACRYFS_00730 [Janthinobacterium lividum]
MGKQEKERKRAGQQARSSSALDTDSIRSKPKAKFGEAFEPRQISWSSCDDIGIVLQKIGVKPIVPGFYDQPAFLQVERSNPHMLELYADYVECQTYSLEYLERAGLMIHKAADYLYTELVVDGRLGACIDASLTLSRFLERLGIWNYVVKGALTYLFPDELKIPKRSIAPLMLSDNPANTGHVWVVAPPFKVVDVTASRQSLGEKLAQQELDGYVVAYNGQKATADVDDLADRDYQELFVHQNKRLPILLDLYAQNPTLKANIEKYGSLSVPLGRVGLKYIATAITAPNAPLEDMENLSLSGRFPRQLFEEFIAAA